MFAALQSFTLTPTIRQRMRNKTRPIATNSALIVSLFLTACQSVSPVAPFAKAGNPLAPSDRLGANHESVRSQPTIPWKFEVVMYDHPQGASVAVSDAQLLDDDTLVVPIDVYWKNTFVGYDWYSPPSALRLQLISQDRGLSWSVYKGQPLPEKNFRMKDGSQIRIKWLGYQQHPIKEKAQWETRGYWLYLVPEKNLFSSWSSPTKTGMRGNTPLLLRLKSGALACAYTLRAQNGGMRVCYSKNDGETWDAEHPTVLKDNNARSDGQCLWNFVQFSDGTLFASGWGTKRGCGGGDEISYAVGFRFTENFVTPLRVGQPVVR